MSTTPTSTENKNSEIWSTRLQKELLTLTSDDAPGGSNDDDAKAQPEILPSYVKLKSHDLNIEEGRCEVYFVVDTSLFSTEKTETSTEEDGKGEKKDASHEVEIVIDASMVRKSNGSIDMAASTYPFEKPVARLKSGVENLPYGSTIQNEECIDIDCDWTPSLHLTDAILNVGLKLKESILQDEPVHASISQTEASASKDAVDDLVQGAKRLATSMGKSMKGLVSQPARSRKKNTKKTATSPNEVSIGDEISLLEEPWVDCHGLYSCKAIRRPAFVEDAMFLAATENEEKAKDEQQQRVSNDNDSGDDDGDVPDDLGNFVKVQSGAITKVAGAGFAEAGAMFSRFTQSAKSVLEESFLMITDTHIIELRSSKLNLSTGTVTFAISIELMAKLKFRRQESISLFFKPAPDDPLIFMCPDSAAAVHQIQNVLKDHGVKGKHTNAATQKTIHEALQVVQEIQAKERALEYQPSTERVNEIMDLYRQAAELFESAGDVRHEEVVLHMKKFLALPLTASILDGSYKPEEKPEKAPSKDGPVPEGEVLERTKEQLEDEEEDLSKATDDVFEKNIDTVLNEAKTELDELNDGLGDIDDGDDDDLNDLDEMLAAADKDLADIMSS
mmetsp:Transcript_3591/g.5571  ORF Transcript_3591/g.5571 Transcript_3591/m.5571 type:complete len:617 (+) Transcript_3591:158-2008(+)|eukprot:CAMPEP_0178915182 /NCGR_PEP_ID=MMETSP0786-20121207/11875_1 /TAXON_ID=186022 /ORGANISM="Thalassionema frauenfeldii, Strain CCMP 1798" /LENGTH=616 /DNA_ID=CAMNT_0020588245 /DNA_START=114 /DNA_END=1964 /DNA_ORIENTATION=+